MAAARQTANTSGPATASPASWSRRTTDVGAQVGGVPEHAGDVDGARPSPHRLGVDEGNEDVALEERVVEADVAVHEVVHREGDVVEPSAPLVDDGHEPPARLGEPDEVVALDQMRDAAEGDAADVRRPVLVDRRAGGESGLEVDGGQEGVDDLVGVLGRLRAGGEVGDDVEATVGEPAVGEPPGRRVAHREGAVDQRRSLSQVLDGPAAGRQVLEDRRGIEEVGAALEPARQLADDAPRRAVLAVDLVDDGVSQRAAPWRCG
jgi:hypothetical protein